MKKYINLIEKYYAGGTTLGEESQIAMWLNSDECPEKYYNLRNQFEYFSNFSEKKYRKPRQKIYSMTAAVILALSFVLSYGVFNTEKVYHAEANNLTVILSDSSKIVLRKGSFLTIDNDFNNSNRIVSLKGEAYFEITRNEENPFRVISEKTNVTVLGTKFNYDTKRNHLFVKEGKVKFSSKNKPNQNIYVTLGEESELLNNKQIKPATYSTNLNSSSWMTEQLVFKKAFLKDAIDQIESHYNVTVETENIAIENIIVCFPITSNSYICRI